MLIHQSECVLLYHSSGSCVTSSDLFLTSLLFLTSWYVPLQSYKESRKKGLFQLRLYWRATSWTWGHHTGFLSIPMFAWHLVSSDSGKRQAPCHQQMGCCYAVNISVGRIPSLSIWMSVYPQVYLALLKRTLLTAANSFFEHVYASLSIYHMQEDLAFICYVHSLLHLISPCSFFSCCAARPDKLNVKKQACPWPCLHSVLW